MKSKLSLYEISQEFEAFEELLRDEGGEVTPEIEELNEQLTKLIQSKVDGFVSYVELLKDEIAMADLRIKKATAFKQSRKSLISKLEGFSIDSLRKANVDKFVGGMGQIKLRKPSQVVDILDEDKVPVEYLKHVPAIYSIDKPALKKALKNGEYKGEAARLVDGEQKVMLTLKAV